MPPILKGYCVFLLFNIMYVDIYLEGCIMPLLSVIASLFLVVDSVFIGSFRSALFPVSGRVIDIVVGVFFCISIWKLSGA